ncbi:sensor histidine kinase, partial [Streptomyces odonnellii]|uniref:sensor histidine kinase n=1 Tax=Streptomyces odonnellii TaxID=1417980 RepID=UPI0006269212
MTTSGAQQQAAGVTSRGLWWWGRWRSVVLDVGLAVVSALECALEGVRFADTAVLPVPVGVVFGLLAGAVLLVRRRWPFAVVLVSIAITPAEMGYLMGLVGLYTLAASEAPRRIIGALAGMSLVGTLIVTFVRTRQNVVDTNFDSARWYVPVVAVLMSVGLTAPPVLFGLYVGARRRLMESLRERADSLEQELSLLADRAEQRAEWARTEERTRIAREMHDVVAHRVSLMVVHAAALQAVALKDPQKAVKNAALVGDMGRQALTELREMLGVLRAGEQAAARKAVAGDRADGAAGANGPAQAFSPAVPLAAVARAAAAAAAAAAEDGPGMGDIEALVGQSRETGMVVELSVHGESRPYAPEVEQTAYRVVQEALTNVLKHAAGAKVMVRLAHRESEIAMQVENGPSDGGAQDAGLPSGGNGLVGMRERVTALGGVFVSGET